MPTTVPTHPQIQVVKQLSELLHTPFTAPSNAMCWQRQLHGDFEEIVLKLKRKDTITEVTERDLLALALSDQGQIARDIILNDLAELTAFGALPVLNLIQHYERDDELDFISTDVYSFHVDRSPIATDTFLCTYYGASSDIIANDQVTQKILIPEIRAQLQQLHTGSDDEFEQFLQDYYFDLHYQAHPNAEPINLSTGHLWKLAVDHPTQQVLPCVHRAPVENLNEYRLLLIC